jgi:hypothetical protein
MIRSPGLACRFVGMSIAPKTYFPAHGAMNMNALSGIVSGVAGAAALTAVHEAARKNLPDAPRMDVLGMRALGQSFRAAGQTPPSRERLHELALAGDIVANSAYYSLVALGPPEGAVARGALLGLAAGLGAVFLPGPLGLGSAPSNRTTQTQAMTVGWYLLGGLAAGLAYQTLGSRR